MTNTPPVETALVQAKRVGELTAADQYNAFVERLKEHAHVLTPVTNLNAIPAMWKVLPQFVYLNPDPAAGDVYRDPLFCEGDEVAPTKTGLRKIAQAAGLTTRAVRIDNGTIPDLYEFMGIIRWRGFDAMFHDYATPLLWDLRDTGPLVKRMINAAERKRKPGDTRPPLELIRAQLDAARLHGYRQGASRAINAAIREFGMRQKYTRRELTKPFVCFSMAINPDENNPAERLLVLQSALNAESALGYGGPSAHGPELPALEGHDPLSEDVPVHAGPPAIDVGQPPPATTAPPTTAAGPVLQEVPFEDLGAPGEAADDTPSVLVEKLSKSATTDDYFIYTDIGRLHTTDAGVAKAMNAARTEKRRVRVVLGATVHGAIELIEIVGDTPAGGAQ